MCRPVQRVEGSPSPKKRGQCGRCSQAIGEGPSDREAGDCGTAQSARRLRRDVVLTFSCHKRDARSTDSQGSQRISTWTIYVCQCSVTGLVKSAVRCSAKCTIESSDSMYREYYGFSNVFAEIISTILLLFSTHDGAPTVLLHLEHT